METAPHPHESSHFQLERLILFSDAVFAIAITLLIIEIKVPHFEGQFTDADIAHRLVHQIPEWIGFFISYWVVGIYWIGHHRMFGYVIRYDNKLTFLNLLFLMTIVIMPFSSALYSQYTQLNTPFIVYCLNVATTGICSMLLWHHISHVDRALSHPIPAAIRTHGYLRNLVVPVVFFSAAILALILPGPWSWLSRCMFLFIFPAQMILRRVYLAKPHPDSVGVRTAQA